MGISIFDENSMILINEKPYKTSDAKNLALFHLENFNGFDGCGYFYLGKSLVGCMCVNFVSFTVILIQFRMSDL